MTYLSLKNELGIALNIHSHRSEYFLRVVLMKFLQHQNDNNKYRVNCGVLLFSVTAF